MWPPGVQIVQSRSSSRLLSGRVVPTYQPHIIIYALQTPDEEASQAQNAITSPLRESRIPHQVARRSWSGRLHRRINQSAGTLTSSSAPGTEIRYVRTNQPPRSLLTGCAGARSDLVLAALLHDIGQIIPLAATKEARMTLKEDSPENVGRIGHESIGAQFLRSLGFGDSVCRLVGSHVDAKRYAPFFILP